MKNPRVAFALSFLLCGAGLAYLGKWPLAIANFVGVVALAFLLAVVAPNFMSMFSGIIGLLAASASGAWAMSLAQRMNAEAGRFRLQ